MSLEDQTATIRATIREAVTSLVTDIDDEEAAAAACRGLVARLDSTEMPAAVVLATGTIVRMVYVIATGIGCEPSVVWREVAQAEAAWDLRGDDPFGRLMAESQATDGYRALVARLRATHGEHDR